jgi:ATP-dependent RNA helicase DeaD
LSADGARADAPAGSGEAADARAEAARRRPNRARVFVTLGEKDGADEAKVRAAVAALAPDVEVAAVEVRQSHSFVEVKPDAIEGAVAALNGREFEGKTITAERAKRRRR